MRYIFIIFVLLASPGLWATELFSWHSFEGVLPAKGPLQVTLHGRLRTRQEVQDFQQVRFGPVARVSVNKRVNVLGGYYFQPGDNLARQWRTGHRAFVGLETPSTMGPFSVVIRGVVERHFVSQTKDHNRFRSYVRICYEKRTISPFYQNELLGVADGFHSLRNGVGLKWRLTPELTAEFGYVYDYRRADWGGDRHAIVTTIRFQRAR